MQQATSVFQELSKYVGPKSGPGELLIFDTNQTGTNSLFHAVYSYVDYTVLRQSCYWNTYETTWIESHKWHLSHLHQYIKVMLVLL